MLQQTAFLHIKSRLCYRCSVWCTNRCTMQNKQTDSKDVISTKAQRKSTSLCLGGGAGWKCKFNVYALGHTQSKSWYSLCAHNNKKDYHALSGVFLQNYVWFCFMCRNWNRQKKWFKQKLQTEILFLEYWYWYEHCSQGAFRLKLPFNNK